MSRIDDIGRLARQARIRRGLTQQALADACGLSRQTIAQLEGGTFSDLGIRKVERLLGRLGLALRVEGTAGETPGRRPESRLDRLFGARAAGRRKTALALARATLRALRKRGVSARIAGSLAKGGFRATSDVDYLIEDRGRLPESQIVEVIEASMKGFPFDVVFAERADPVLLRMMRAEAECGTPAFRAP